MAILGADHMGCFLVLLISLGAYREKQMTRPNSSGFPLTYRDIFPPNTPWNGEANSLLSVLSLNICLSCFELLSLPFLETSPLPLDRASFLWCLILSSPHQWLIVILQVQLCQVLLSLPWLRVNLQVQFSQFFINKWRLQKFWSLQFFLRKPSFQDGCVARYWRSIIW